MRRRIAIILVLLTGGAMVNVAVAWGCAIWSTARYDESRASQGNQHELGRYLKTHGIKMRLHSGEWVYAHASAVGVHWVQFGRPCPEGDCDPREAWHQHLAGFPVRSLGCHGSVIFPPRFVGGELVCDVEWRGGFVAPALLKPELTWFFLLPSVSRPLPYHILPVGFIINTLFYALLLWLLFFAPGSVRRWLRRRRGLCEKCAYPIGVSEVCTECGARLACK